MDLRQLRYFAQIVESGSLSKASRQLFIAQPALSRAIAIAERNKKVFFADGNLFFNRSGMTAFQTPEIIAEMLHGVTFGEATENVHWRRMALFGLPRSEAR